MTSSDVALRVAYFSLNLVGALANSLTFFVLCLSFRRATAHDGPFLMSMALCLSRIISTVSSCLLLFSGAMTGNAAPRSVCIAQSGLQASQAPLLAYSILSYALNVHLLIPPPSLLMGTAVATATTAALLLLPFLTFAPVAIVSALIASQNPSNVHIRSFYCFLDQQDIRNGSAILAGIALLATIATLSRVFYILSVKVPSTAAASGSRWPEGILLHFYFLGLYATLRLGILVANRINPLVTADMVDAADGIIIFVILGTQPWLFKHWQDRFAPGASNAGADHRPRRSAGLETTGDRGHDQFLRRVAEYPSVIEIQRADSRRQGVVNQHHQQAQTPKLRALNAALGLAANDPYTRYHGSGDLLKGEKRTTITHPDLRHHPYSLDPRTRALGSQLSLLSLKTLEYGVALGHPSRDGSARNSVQRAAGTGAGAAENAAASVEGRASSLIIISTPSDASSHALHLPLEDDAPAATAAPERQRRRVSPLAIPGISGISGIAHSTSRQSRRTSDGSGGPPPLTPPLIAFERVRRGNNNNNNESPRLASFVGVSMESINSSLSPRVSSRAIRTSSVDPPPASPARRLHFSSSTGGEGSVYHSASSDSSGHMLVDDIQSSVLSWPNGSRSSSRFLSQQQLQQQSRATGEEDTRHTSFGAFPPRLSPGGASHAYWIHQQYATSSPEEPPHPAFLRETTPSPLSLNDEGSVGAHTFGGGGGGGSTGGHTFGGGSPVERRFHPYTRGPSPLRPPGLGSPLSRWTEVIEETRKGSDESG